MQAAETGVDTRKVLAFDSPPFMAGTTVPTDQTDLYERAFRRIEELPGVDAVAAGSLVPWRDAGFWTPWQFAVEGYTPADGEENPHAGPRFVSPGFFRTLGIRIVAGRDFTPEDREGAEKVVMVSQSLAQRLFPNGEALNRKVWLTERMFKPDRMRIVGVVADVDDENVVRSALMTIYYPYRQMGMANRLFVRTTGDPYALVPSVTRIFRELAPDGPIERAATLEDVRTEVLTPERTNTFVLTGFGGIALLIAAVGIGGVLAFSVSARTREFGVRLAVGSSPRHLLLRVLGEGTRIVSIGIVAGLVGGGVFVGLAESALGTVPLPHALPLLGAATVLLGAAVAASLIPAARAARVDVVQALRSE